jgi:TolB-like protein
MRRKSGDARPFVLFWRGDLAGLQRMRPTSPVTLVVNGVVVDLSNETLLAGEEARVLRPQSFATLRHLIENPNRLVTKDELMAAVWRGVAVTDDSLVQCIHEIRRAIGDEAHVVLQTAARRGYRLVLPESVAVTPPAGASIAVLPFEALDPDGGYFADGLAEDLITSLSKIAGLFVIARNSSFAYRGGSVDPRRAAAELGVRYLLQGSVRRAGGELRINARLVDGASAAQVWAGRFDGAAADVFALQDRLTEQIVGAIEPSIRRAEIERARRKHPESLDAYDLSLRAVPHVLANSPEGRDRALTLLDAALALDPGYLPAHGYAAWCREQRYFRGGFDPADREAALRHADAALAVNADDPQAMSIGAFVRGILTRDYDGAAEVLDRALAMNGNSALAFGFSALVASHSERYERADAHAGRALRLSPLDDPLNYHPYCALTLSNLFTGRFAESVRYASLTIRANPGFSVPYAYLVAGQVSLGDREAARAAAARLLEVAPAFTVVEFARMNQFRPPLMGLIVAALREAGLPESGREAGCS